MPITSGLSNDVTKSLILPLRILGTSGTLTEALAKRRQALLHHSRKASIAGRQDLQQGKSSAASSGESLHRYSHQSQS
ncbi:hypothetical protein BST61_g1323 [Cercospora zeina]